MWRGIKKLYATVVIGTLRVNLPDKETGNVARYNFPYCTDDDDDKVKVTNI